MFIFKINGICIDETNGFSIFKINGISIFEIKGIFIFECHVVFSPHSFWTEFFFTNSFKLRSVNESLNFRQEQALYQNFKIKWTEPGSSISKF